MRKPADVVAECADLIETHSWDPMTMALVVMMLRRTAEALEAGKDEVELSDVDKYG